MVSIDVRQAALVAISKGWYLYSDTNMPFPFSTAELLIAAGLYNGSIEPAVQDNVTHGLKVIIDHLPKECDVFFTIYKSQSSLSILLCLDNWAHTHFVNLSYLDCSRLDFT